MEGKDNNTIQKKPSAKESSSSELTKFEKKSKVKTRPGKKPVSEQTRTQT